MSFRIATLNLARNEKRWDERRELVASEIAALKPDILALNEIWLPLQTGQWLRQHARLADSSYTLVQQAKSDSDQPLEAEGLLSRFEALAHAHRFYAKKDAVALVTRLEIDGRLVDVYVTHLYAALRPDALRAEQVTELINWTHERDDVPDKILCGDCNSTLESDSMKLLASEFRPTQTLPTAFTPLA